MGKDLLVRTSRRRDEVLGLVVWSLGLRVFKPSGSWAEGFCGALCCCGEVYGLKNPESLRNSGV